MLSLGLEKKSETEIIKVGGPRNFVLFKCKVCNKIFDGVEIESENENIILNRMMKKAGYELDSTPTGRDG